MSTALGNHILPTGDSDDVSPQPNLYPSPSISEHNQNPSFQSENLFHYQQKQGENKSKIMDFEPNWSGFLVVKGGSGSGM